MTLSAALQPDQQPARWNHHVDVYEAVFEPLSNSFARHALDLLAPRAGERLIDIGAGSGGAALLAAGRGADVLAVDASERMVARIRERAVSARAGHVHTAVMNGMALAVADASFDAAMSVFGVILFPDATGGMRQIARALKAGGRTAVVAWTESERYELINCLIDAIAKVRGPPPAPPTLPAQLRFREPAAFSNLLTGAGLHVERIVRVEEAWRLPSARWLADRLPFAPGMSAMLGALGAERDAIIDQFVAALTASQGDDEISLCAVGQIAIATKPGGGPEAT